jgi:hypothetical protein
MTPKLKAEELVKVYAKLIWDEKEFKMELYKQCAIKSVDEILRSHHNLYGVNNKEVKFYSEVKQEIQKL